MVMALLALVPEAWSRTALVTGRESHRSEPCRPMLSGWQTTSNRISDRLSASSTRCALEVEYQREGGGTSGELRHRLRILHGEDYY
jgi:hypothetical protein